MFTGIIQAKGTVLSAQNGRFSIQCPWESSSIDIGASIACDGCCLTVVTVGPNPEGGSAFEVDVSDETLSKTTLGSWAAGQKINLERSLRVGDEMGGHIVSGHVDGVGKIETITLAGFSKIFTISVPQDLSKYIAPKGSVALNGTSLTVNEVSGNIFTINLVPHTLDVTTWGQRKAGELVNFEIDVIARYAARLLAFKEGE